MKIRLVRHVGALAAFSLLAGSAFAGGDKKKTDGDKKKDPDEIGNRDVGKGVNFYSIEKEIGLGKGLALVNGPDRRTGFEPVGRGQARRGRPRRVVGAGVEAVRRQGSAAHRAGRSIHGSARVEQSRRFFFA